MKGIVIDFEESLWRAIALAFPDRDIDIRGCTFHWTQAIWRKVQELGLQPSYMAKDVVFKFVKQIMALPFLPHNHIEPMFERLQAQAPQGTLGTLTDYVSATWIHSAVWPPATWSLFQQSVRTNNDVEGYHNKINRRAKRGKLQFYLLISFLHTEATLMNFQVRLVSEKKLCRNHRTKAREMQGRLFQLWDEYVAGDKTPKQLLKACSHLNGPVVQ